MARQPGSNIRPPQVEERIGVRGCLELILKLIIGLLVIMLVMNQWMARDDQVAPWQWIVFLFLLAFLIWLIIIQGHFIKLKCKLTEPTGCKHGDPNLLPPHILEPIIGTASAFPAFGFGHYELEILWNGTTSIADAVIYADGAGNPDTTLTSGNHQVTNGMLGFVDFQKAVDGAGANILISTQFDVRLHVFASGGASTTCTTTFSIIAARAYIKTIGGAVADDVTDLNEKLTRVDNSTDAVVGGNISLRGAADAYGCSSQVIQQYSLWYKAGFVASQPAIGSTYDPVADGWSNITTVVFSDSLQRSFNRLDGMPDPDFLTNSSTWGTRSIPIVWDSIMTSINVPDLKEFWWNSESHAGSGKFSFLLKLEDTGGNLYYDVQHAWIDNEDIKAQIAGPSGVAACQDIYLLDVPGGILEIEGYATDPLVVPGDPAGVPTNDNFREYKVGFRKQGAASDFWLDIPLAGGSHGGLSETTPVPDRSVWTGATTDPANPPISVLAEWKMDWLTGANVAVPADQLLAPDESCTYDIVLEVWDKTIFHEHYTHPHWSGRITFPVKIHNAHAPAP